ncbi:MAG: glycosyltransferase family 4 protein [Acidimicrobiia bacterium]|nr:glycosyltransferase family 4 protein [Acidimicrobiia bacterium]
MKVAVVSPYALDSPGGVQNQVIEIAARLGEHGIESWVVGPGRTGPAGARLLGPGISIPANGSLAPICLKPSVMRRVRESVEGADVIHLHEPLLPLVGWSLLRSAEVPTVGTFHADPSSLVRSIYRRLRPVASRLLSKLSVVTAVSEVAASAVRPLVPQITIIPNAIDTATSRSEIRRLAHRVTFLGRDEPRKGLDLLLSAWPAIKQSAPEAELDIMGTDRSDLIPGVRFLGRVDEIEKREALAAASIFVAPNLGGESFGITLLEGMAAGCAVVASDLPAFTAVGGSAATYFPTGNATELELAIVGLLQDVTRRESASEAAIRRSEDFDWATVLPAYIHTYELARRGH